MAQRRPGEHLCPALPVPRVRLPAGDEQRGLARDAEVRHSGARSHRLRAGPALLDEGEPCDMCQYTSFLTATATVTLCFVCDLLSQAHRRQKQLSDYVEKKKYWTLRKGCGSQVSEPEERKKSRGKRGSLCARRRSRKTVTCHGLCVVEPVYIRPYCAADGGTGGELRGRASLVIVDVLTEHICWVSLCLYVPTEREKYVWLAQSRRRPKDWDLEGGLTRQCNARPSFLITCCVRETPSQDDGGGLLHRAARARHRQAL